MDWQPIESAPKDESEILAIEWTPDQPNHYSIFEIRWDDGLRRWILTSSLRGDGSYFVDPTYWMPRPKQPNEQTLSTASDDFKRVDPSIERMKAMEKEEGPLRRCDNHRVPVFTRLWHCPQCFRPLTRLDPQPE